MPVVNQKALGVLLGAGAGAIWAVEAVLGKLLFSSLTFVQVAGSEVFFAALTGFTYVLAKREPLKLSRRNMRDTLFVGLVGTVFAPLMYFLGLTQTFAVNATLIAHTQPLLVAILGSYLLRERLRRHDLFAGALIGCAAILITGRTLDNLTSLNLGNSGDLLIFLATLGWALVAIPGKQLTKELGSAVIVGYRFLIASILFLPMLLCMNQLVLTSVYQVLLGMVVGLGYIFYYEGLKRIKASEVALTELSSPFFASVLAWSFLSETTTPMQAMGALLLMIGLYFLTRERSESSTPK